MTKYCQNRLCHYNNTTDRIRAKKSAEPYYVNRTARGYFGMFCSQGCMLHYIQTHINKVIAIAPRLEALETPIEVKVETHTDWRGNPYKQKRIQAIDNG